ncbi:MAG: FecR family protein [Candidatus Sericytochromatia bacterium]
MKKQILSSIVSILLVGFPLNSYAQDTYKVASTANIQRDAIIVRIATGEVEKKLAGTNEWIPVAIGSDLADNDIIKTGKNSTILLELPENTGFVRLMPETELKVDKIKVEKGFEGGQVAELSISKGKVVTKVRKLNRKSSRLQIKTKGATAAVRGTAFLTSYTEDKETKVLVGDGQVAVKAQGQEVLVDPGKYTKVDNGNKPVNPDLVGNNLDFKISNMKMEQGNLRFIGNVDPDAEVRLNKNAVFANSDGSFNGVMSLNQGVNNAIIKVSTIDGRMKLNNIKVLKYTE